MYVRISTINISLYLSFACKLLREIPLTCLLLTKDFQVKNFKFKFLLISAIYQIPHLTKVDSKNFMTMSPKFIFCFNKSRKAKVWLTNLFVFAVEKDLQWKTWEKLQKFHKTFICDFRITHPYKMKGTENPEIIKIKKIGFQKLALKENNKKKIILRKCKLFLEISYLFAIPDSFMFKYVCVLL